jgi:hypothetical protein
VNALPNSAGKRGGRHQVRRRCKHGNPPTGNMELKKQQAEP